METTNDGFYLTAIAKSGVQRLTRSERIDSVVSQECAADYQLSIYYDVDACKLFFFNNLKVGMAEREGFEPPIPVKVCLISSQVHSTGLCHLSMFTINNLGGNFSVPLSSRIVKYVANPLETAYVCFEILAARFSSKYPDTPASNDATRTAVFAASN